MEVLAPPPVPETGRAGTVARLLPAGTAIAGVAMTGMLLSSASAGRPSPVFLLLPLVMVLSAAAMLVHGRSGGSAAQLDRQRDTYLDYLAGLSTEVTADLDRQRRRLLSTSPPPRELWAIAGSTRMWERRPADADFGYVRVGTGARPSGTRLEVAAGGGDEDPVTATALRRVVDGARVVTDAPIAVGLNGIPVLGVGGDPDRARARIRALLCQLAVWHSPADLWVAAALAPERCPEWDWMKWLPHHRHPADGDDAGAARLRYRSVAEATEQAPGCWLVVVADGVPIPSGGLPDGVTVVSVDDHPGGGDGMPPVDRADLMSIPDARGCARRLARYRPAADEDRAGPSWAALLRGGAGAALQAPIGVTADGAALSLDINESAAGGMGPHGLCVGATGSGKSELLRTIVLGMIARHPSEDLNLVLVDFKGGATFLGFDRANHTAAVLTNLADEAYLVARMREALTGEINRRQRILRDAGNLASLDEYRRLRPKRGLPPLPALFVVVDEFSELLSAHPDFIDVFVAIGRLGRSLGIHLLLATQRLDEGRLRGLDSHLSYRICLKTLSANESRAVIGTADAYHLPPDPGAGYLKVAACDPVAFRAARVSVAAPGPQARDRREPPTGPCVFTADPVGPVRRAAEPPAVEDPPRLLDTVLDGLCGRGPAAHPVWLPPLDEAPALTTLLERTPPRPLTVPLGVVDRVFEHRRATLELDLAGGAGHLAVVGAPQSGKSGALRCVAAGLALRHDPAQVQLYCLDFGGGGLSTLAELPHVGAVAGRVDPDLTRRIVTETAALVRRREALFRERGLSAMDQYRRRRDPDEDPFGDVFLLVDGWQALRQGFETEEAALTGLAAEGLSYGVHLLLSAGRWADLRPALKDQIGTRIELRLAEPTDSEIDRHRARLVPARPPGRGLSPDGEPLAIAAPTPVETIRAARAWTTTAPRIATLPARVAHDGLVAAAGDRGPVLGIEDAGLKPVVLSFGVSPHLVISGDAECGKTTTLRVLCREIARTVPPSRRRLVVVDPRRGLGGCADPGRGDVYVGTAAGLAEVVGPLAQTLRAGIAGPAGPQPAPELFLVVDDYDLLAGERDGPLEPLRPLLPHARDIGMHLILARRPGARTRYEPTLTAVHDAGAMTLRMNTCGDEAAGPGGARHSTLPAGRGVLVTRGRESLVQVGWVPDR
ncbi:type VII secretion protein EccCb [Mycolicibacterium palauense]|uniref:type VII secretion protein EccCb n=1 Tax=Mycolicibacterium palauense TaxID=2034511 RepID=UPI000BFF092F